MRRATITEAKNGLSQLIDRVRAGESVLILDRGVPVARLDPVSTQPDQPGRLERLERGGVLRRAHQSLAMERLEAPPPRPADGTSALAVVLEERRAGR